MTKQVKSKQRVSDHGEVYTAEREVNAMLDLVKQETERIDSRFLEPACGNGNFLAEILRRKLAVVKKKYGKSAADYEKNAIIALTSIYGVDILSDNAQECRERLFDIWDKEYTKNCKSEADDICRGVARYILEKNILCGDALTLEQSNGEPIIFAEWSFVTGGMIKRRDFTLSELLKVEDEKIDVDMLLNGWEYDEETNKFIPAPIKEYDAVHYRRLNENV